ncbi:hypothetical protein [Streptomyces alanosinicus]|uniref:Uncharacterized protein n=1 Tax=Streptomyces alanosinicus TaxID=68171 RepID=A0A919D690_9ACTN|nr:hypothetical protein [Streptomyces alanosinicus]GHE13828.1 hypothetical protein GCM10010339_82310 [Streptomyces alanosinicus]
MTTQEAVERAKQFERLAVGWAKKAQEGHAGAAELAQTFGSLAAAARTEHMNWRMRVLGDQLEDVKKSMDMLRRKLPDR